MPSNIKKNSEFISLVIKSTPQQARALLYTNTNEQAKAIAEIFYNLLHINQVNNRKYKLLTRRTKFLKNVINKKNRSSFI
jgi:hypothetical protein